MTIKSYKYFINVSPTWSENCFSIPLKFSKNTKTNIVKNSLAIYYYFLFYIFKSHNDYTFLAEQLIKHFNAFDAAE
jgi:hypothetical protein